MEKSLELQQVLANFKINVNTSKATLYEYITFFLKKAMPDQADSLVSRFTQVYEKTLLSHEREDLTDLARLYRLLIEFKPSLATVISPGKEFDSLCDIIAQQFNVTLDRVRRQINEGKPQKSRTGVGSSHKGQPIHLQYFCTVCKQSFEIPLDVHAQLLNSDEKISLPKHHDKEMVVKIGQPDKENPPEKESDERIKIEIYPAELLMQHASSAESRAEYLKLVSVGIDVGSSTSHLVFSRLTLKREQSFFNMSNRFVLVNRELIYEGNIIFTPLLDSTTIDIDAVIQFCEEEYKNANLTPEQVDTGAVIVTGETAKKKNAAEIVQRLSSKSGKFVSASAGPNYESVLAAMGSGIVDLTRKKQNTILNVDVGGGSSKLAVVSKGDIRCTSSTSIGGRLVGIDKDFKIWRIDDPSRVIMKELGMDYQIGDIISERDVSTIGREYAKALIEVMRRPATSTIAKKLMMTSDLDFSLPIDEISFSGGVAELIYKIMTMQAQGKKQGADESLIPYNDIGWYLAREIVSLVDELKLPVVEPENKIRATVIGAGAFSLSVSGSTCYHDPSIRLPLENVPVVSINTSFKDMGAGGAVKTRKFKDTVALALNNFNLIEGVDTFALFFNDINIRANLTMFSKALEAALPDSFSSNKPIIIVLGFDGAKMLGLTIKKETSRHENLFCLDELFLEDGDWIDIGQPLGEDSAFPITIKSLVFNQSTQKEDILASKREERAASTDKIPLDTVSRLNPVGVARAFREFQTGHAGYESLLVITPEGQLEFSTDEKFWTPKNACNLHKAWQEHEQAFFLGEDRFPIISWAELQFAARNTNGKGIVVGTKTKTNRYVVMKVDPGSKWRPNIAALAAKLLNLWSWDII